jgi:hypothetical protein
MGRKKKYATPEEAREAFNRKRRAHNTATAFEDMESAVGKAPDYVKLFLAHNQGNYEAHYIDPADIYIYAMFGVDMTISVLTKRLEKFYSYRENKSDSMTKTEQKLLVYLSNQLRFRSWLKEKAGIAIDQSKAGNVRIRWEREKARQQAEQTNQTNQEGELTDDDSTTQN